MSAAVRSQRRPHSVTVWRGGLVIVGLLVIAWLLSHLHWVEEKYRIPAKGQAAGKHHYVLGRLVRELGGTLEEPGEFSRMPPRQATLWLDEGAWTRGDERSEQLRAWVQQGGHLVVSTSLLGRAEPEPELESEQPRQDDEEGEDPGVEFDKTVLARTGLSWIPIRVVFQVLSASATVPQQRAASRCAPMVEAGLAGHYFRDPGPYRVLQWCPGHFDVALRAAGGATQWVLAHGDRAQVMRVRVGAGTVTAIALPGLLEDQRLLDDDRASIAAAALQLRRGAEVWIVRVDARESLWAWLSSEAPVALVLGTLALAAAIWRSAVRFGPLCAPDIASRRSMAEQIVGTARFLLQHEPAELHAATARALDRLAAQRCPLYAEAPRGDRARWLARVCGADGSTLQSALEPRRPRRRSDWLRDIEVLESARRRLAGHDTQDPSILQFP